MKVAPRAVLKIAESAKQDFAQLVSRVTSKPKFVVAATFEIGQGGGANADRPDVVFGLPSGGSGDGSYGSTDTVSLGVGGRATLKLEGPVSNVLVIAENPMGEKGGALNPEPGLVEGSADGVKWQTLPKLAGFEPVFIDAANAVSPKSRKAGGDRFDLKAIGVDKPIQYVRITDLGKTVGPNGGGSTAGFDLAGAWGW